MMNPVVDFLGFVKGSQSHVYLKVQLKSENLKKSHSLTCTVKSSNPSTMHCVSQGHSLMREFTQLI